MGRSCSVLLSVKLKPIEFSYCNEIELEQKMCERKKSYKKILYKQEFTTFSPISLNFPIF